MIKLVIIDFDGVIADTILMALNVANKIASAEGYKNRLNTTDLRTLGLYGIIKKHRVPIYKVPQYIHASRKLVKSGMHKVKPIPGMKSAIKKLRQDYMIAMVTSNANENVETFLRRNGIATFNIIIAGVNVFGKAGSMKNAVKAAGVKMREAICIGDEVRDIKAARKAGLKIVAVSWGFNSIKLLESNKPDYMVTKPSQISGLLKRIK